jgi:hypothetical protein
MYYLTTFSANMCSATESRKKYSYLILQSVSRANAINMNAPPLHNTDW